MEVLGVVNVRGQSWFVHDRSSVPSGALGSACLLLLAVELCSPQSCDPAPSEIHRGRSTSEYLGRTSSFVAISPLCQAYLVRTLLLKGKHKNCEQIRVESYLFRFAESLCAAWPALPYVEETVGWLF